MIDNKLSKKRKRTLKRTKNFRDFFSSNFLNILGVLFLFMGLFYLIDSYYNGLYQLVSQFFTASGPETLVGDGAISQDYFFELLSYFSPAILGLFACIIFYEKIKQWVLPISILLIFYLLYFHFKIGFNCDSLGVYIFSNFFVAALLLLVITTLLTLIFFRSKKSWFLFFVVFQFYASLFVVKLQFSNFYIIPSSFVFSVGLFWVGNRVKSVSAVFINFIFAILFFSYFALKKLILGSFPEYLPFFLVFSLLFYLLFLIMSLSKPFQDKKEAFLVFSLANNLVYFILNALVLDHYLGSIYVVYPILILGAFQVAGLLYSRKTNLKSGVFPLELTLVLLIAGLFMVLLNQDGTALLFGAVSIVLIKHTLIDKNKRGVGLSFACILMMTLYFIYSFIPILSALLNLEMEGMESLLIANLLNVVGTAITLYFVKKYVVQLHGKVSKKEFNVERYLVFLSGFLLVTVFVLLEGISFILVHLLTHTFLYSSLILFLLGSLFFLILFKNIEIVDVKLRKLLFGMMLLFVFLFPITEYFDVPISKDIYLLSSNFSLPRIVLHYIGLIFFLVIASVFIKKTDLKNSKNNWFQHLIEVLSSLVFLLIVCKEYDFISILVHLANSKTFSILDLNLVLDTNAILPYFILALLCLLSILFYGLANKNRFLKAISIIGAGMLFVRTFIFEDNSLFDDFRVLNLFILGIMVLLFSWSEKKIKKERRANRGSIS